jgi:hypothetical protein
MAGAGDATLIVQVSAKRRTSVDTHVTTIRCAIYVKGQLNFVTTFGHSLVSESTKITLFFCKIKIN